MAKFDAKTLSKMPATATEQSTLSDVTTETILFEFAAEESQLSLLRAFLKVFLLQNLPVSMLLYQQILLQGDKLARTIFWGLMKGGFLAGPQLAGYIKFSW